MRMRALYFSLPLSLLLFVIGCLSGYTDIRASAALSGGQYMTTQQALDIFGSSISCQYFNGTDYVDGTFLYDSSYQLTSYNSRSVTDYIVARPYFLRYVATLNNVSTDRSYITVDVRPSYSIFDTSQLHTCIALSTGNVLPGGSFDSPSWDWYWGGSSVHLENNVLQQGTNGYRATLYIASANCTYVPCDFTSQSATSGYSVRACFCGNSGISTNQYYLYIGVPYVDSGASGINGTTTEVTTSSGSGGDINVNVDVDMSETNGILNTISSILSSIVDGIQGLFVPDTSWMNAWYESVEDTLDDVFGASSAASAMVEQAFTTLIQGTAVNSIYFPAIEIPNLSGGVVTLYAGGNVPLLPQNTNFTVASGFLGSASLYDYMKYLIDIVATMAVINMVRTKLHAILVGEVVATNDGGDDE